jgi:histidyl-tRNA synthetase
MQRVYRGERAQRGRFREFYQCDIDVIGKDALSVRFDAECPRSSTACSANWRSAPFTIQLNNRKLMRGFFEGLGVPMANMQRLVLREVDKLDKRGEEYVRATLWARRSSCLPMRSRRSSPSSQLRSTSHADAMAKLDALGGGNGMLRGRASPNCARCSVSCGARRAGSRITRSICRSRAVWTTTPAPSTRPRWTTIRRSVRSARAAATRIWPAHYTKSKLPGVGISIGLTRLFWQLREAGLIAPRAVQREVLVALMDEADLPKYLALANQLRAAGINTEVQLEAAKLGKQFQYAIKAGIRFVLVLGETRWRRHGAVKDMPREAAIRSGAPTGQDLRSSSNSWQRCRPGLTP